MIKSQMKEKINISNGFDDSKNAVIFNGDCLDMLKQIPDKSIQLVVTSPPYNIGKEYEKKININIYIEQQRKVIKECVRVLNDEGSICWQVGNYVAKSGIIPLDTILYPIFSELELIMRNRIVWHFEHGLHCKNRFSGRYETINWFTKTNNYVFNLDPVRVPQKYPGKKYFKGPKAGQFSCNPLGKNPGDLWIIPNVKNNHIEKTDHPCQFPIELVERLILSMTDKDDWVLDPFLGAGTSVIATLLHQRRGIGAEVSGKYIKITKERIGQMDGGTLRKRPMNKPVYDPKMAGNRLTESPWEKKPNAEKQINLLESHPSYS